MSEIYNGNNAIVRTGIYLFATESMAGIHTAFYSSGTGALVLKVAEPNREINNSPPSNEQIKNVRNFTSTPLMPRE
jgi:hypothetical protein